ncbi:hypothetical protein SKUL_5 [Pseudomonas phage Skulduggery]|uniref:Uncharacterized protein n=1 Tax=Pseudomonas phage Skulduggery TaxID=2006671 RepID=A0A1Y0SWY3_9CAUD|nr:hypothetical protein PP627_gp05 [Pseudomonas phage Skulduggery]ARV77104.1 hypothetical protein SKUL_5 [Pseudomonas phage Skulduggery]
MRITNGTDETTEPVVKVGIMPAYLIADGAGSVQLQRRNVAGQWMAYPEMTFDLPAAKVLDIPKGEYRLVGVGGPMNVEYIA